MKLLHKRILKTKVEGKKVYRVQKRYIFYPFWSSLKEKGKIMNFTSKNEAENYIIY